LFLGAFDGRQKQKINKKALQLFQNRMISVEFPFFDKVVVTLGHYMNHKVFNR
jgi:hypothetical protein